MLIAIPIVQPLLKCLIPRSRSHVESLRFPSASVINESVRLLRKRKFEAWAGSRNPTCISAAEALALDPEQISQPMYHILCFYAVAPTWHRATGKPLAFWGSYTHSYALRSGI